MTKTYSLPEPNPGSVLMMNGILGTAVQRLKSDGKYHTVTGKVYDTIHDLQEASSQPLHIIFEAPKDDEQ